VRRNGPEAERGLRMLYEAFKECGIKGEIYDSSLPLTEAPVRLKELIDTCQAKKLEEEEQKKEGHTFTDEQASDLGM